MSCKQEGVKVVCIPQRGGTKAPEREAYEKSREFKDGERFRAGIEGVSEDRSPVGGTIMAKTKRRLTISPQLPIACGGKRLSSARRSCHHGRGPRHRPCQAWQSESVTGFRPSPA